VPQDGHNNVRQVSDVRPQWRHTSWTWRSCELSAPTIVVRLVPCCSMGRASRCPSSLALNSSPLPSASLLLSHSEHPRSSCHRYSTSIVRLPQLRVPSSAARLAQRPRSTTCAASRRSASSTGLWPRRRHGRAELRAVAASLAVPRHLALHEHHHQLHSAMPSSQHRFSGRNGRQSAVTVGLPPPRRRRSWPRRRGWSPTNP
jgi:hypothetical protein